LPGEYIFVLKRSRLIIATCSGLYIVCSQQNPDSVDDLYHELDRAITAGGRRVSRMRRAIPSEESVIVLMAETATDKSAFHRASPAADLDNDVFPDEGSNIVKSQFTPGFIEINVCDLSVELDYEIVRFVLFQPTASSNMTGN